MKLAFLTLPRSPDPETLCQNCRDMDFAKSLDEYAAMFPNRTPLYSPTVIPEYSGKCVPIHTKSDNARLWSFQIDATNVEPCVCCSVILDVLQLGSRGTEEASGLFKRLLKSSSMKKSEEEVSLRWKNGRLQLVLETSAAIHEFAASSKPGTHLQYKHLLCTGTTRQSFVNSGEAKRFINNCIQNHQTCRNRHSDEIPVLRNLRLIDCSTTRIISAPDGARFAALSYVWGKPPLLGISRRDFPRTIEDAVTVTKGLGLEYLWVDAYCIDQKDPIDLLQQLRQMDRVYHAAEVTIIASGSESASTGLYGVSVERNQGPGELFVDGVAAAEYNVPH